jgi:hypothetical protein
MESCRERERERERERKNVFYVFNYKATVPSVAEAARPAALPALVYLGIRCHNDSHDHSKQPQRAAENLHY